MIVLAAALLSCASAPCAFVNARVEVGDGAVLERATVVVRGDRIVSVGTAPAPAGATVIDAAGKTITPGLFEARTHVGLTEVELEPSANDALLPGAALVPGLRAADGYDPHSSYVPITREEGVTSAVVFPMGGLLSGSGAYVELRSALSARPDPTRPAAIAGALGFAGASTVGGTRPAAMLRLREALADARLYARDPAAFAGNRVRPLALSPGHLEALVPVLRGEVPLVLEAHRATDILAALELARDEKLRVAIAGGIEAWLVAERLAAARVPVIVTPSDQVPASFDRLRARDDNPALLARAGVPLVISTGVYDVNPRRLRQEAGVAVAYGLPRARALAAITSAPAALYGRADVGLVAVGKRANLVLWSGDPLELSSIAERVLIGGEEQPADSRQRNLARRYREGLPYQE